jgi:hypothetical protein
MGRSSEVASNRAPGYGFAMCGFAMCGIEPTTRGRSQGVDDFVPNTPSGAPTNDEHRRMGASMSADDIVDFVLEAPDRAASSAR